MGDGEVIRIIAAHDRFQKRVSDLVPAASRAFIYDLAVVFFTDRGVSLINRVIDDIAVLFLRVIRSERAELLVTIDNCKGSAAEIMLAEVGIERFG